MDNLKKTEKIQFLNLKLVQVPYEYRYTNNSCKTVDKRISKRTVRHVQSIQMHANACKNAHKLHQLIQTHAQTDINARKMDTNALK